MRAAIFNILSERIARKLRKDFYDSLINKDIAFFDSKRTGDLSKWRLFAEKSILKILTKKIFLCSFSLEL